MLNANVMFLLTACGTYAIVIGTEWKIMKRLGAKTNVMSENTRRMHTEVHKALVASVS